METSQNMIKILMDGLALTEPEANAFVGLYAKGYVTVSSIATYAEVGMDEANKILKKFLEKGLTLEIQAVMEEGKVPRYMPTVPWGAFTSYLDNFKGTVGNHRLTLDKHIKEHIVTLNKEVQLLKDGVSNAVNNQIEKFNEETLKSKEKTSQTIAKHITDLNDNVEKKKQDTSAVYDEKIAAHKKLIKEDFESETSSALDNKYKVITDGCKSIEDNTTSEHEKAIKTLQDTVNNTFDTHKSKTIDIITGYQKDTYGDYDQFVNDLDQHQNETFSQYDSWFDDLSKKLLEQIELEVKGVHKKNDTLKNYTKVSQEKDYDWFKDRAAQLRERAAKTFNDEIENQENTFSQFKDSITGITSDLVIRFKDILSQIQNTFVEKITSQLETLKKSSTIENILTENLDKRLGALEAEINANKDKLKSKIESEFNKLNDNLNTLLKDSSEKLKQINGDIKKDIKEVNKTSKTQIDQVFKDLETELERWQKENSEESEEWIKKVADSANNVKNSLGEGQESLKASIGESIDNLKQNKGSLKLKEIIKTQKDKIKVLNSKLNDQLDQNQEKSVEKIDSLQRETIETLTTTINQKLDSFKDINQDSQKNASEALNNNIEYFKEKAKNFGEESSNLFNSQTEKIETDFYQIKDSIGEGNESLVKKFKDILEEVKERFLEKIIDQVKRLRNDTANLEKTLSETLDDRTDTYRNEIDSARKEFYDGLDNHVQSLETQSHAIRDESVTKLLADIIAKNKESLKGIQIKRNETVSSHKSTQDGLKDGRFTELNETNDGMKNEVASFVNSDIERVNTLATDIHEKVSSEVKNGYSSIKTEIASIDDKYLALIDELTTSTGKQNNDIIEKHRDAFQSDASTMEIELLDLTTAHQNEYELNANSLNDQILSKLEETDVIITDRLTNTDNDAAKTFKECEANSEERAKILRAVWVEAMRVLAINSELTWVLTSEDAIKEYMADMVLRTKSTISVVTPDFSDLPVAAINNARRQIRVKTASRILADSRNEVAKLLEQGNVEVRQRPEMDLYAAARENEEVLLAPYAPGKPSHQVAIISQQPSIVQFVHEIIGPLVIARATKITRV